MVLTKNDFKRDFEAKLTSMFRKRVEETSELEQYLAFGTLLTEYISRDWYLTDRRYAEQSEKQVYYFSMEFLIGRLMDANLMNLGIREICSEGLADFGISLQLLEDVEADAGLGNGGLGRLAACFLDSMASLGIAGHGNGIRYRYGLFEQQIRGGYQTERPDNWLKIRNVWETRRDDEACIVKFGGTCDVQWLEKRLVVNQRDYEPVLAVPYDMPVPGYGNHTVNTLRLWSAEPKDSGFDFASFCRGDYEKAAEGQISAAAITDVLYPDDATQQGKTLRLKQEYFFTSAGIQSIVRNIKKRGLSLYEFDRYVAIHMNDTHPVLAVPELMRILIDEEAMDWEDAWAVTVRTMGYTNHTILAEALEKWDLGMFRHLLPRICMIVEEINRRFCAELSARYAGDQNKIKAMSIIQDNMVKMAHLAIVGSHSVNGVAELHTEILKNQELADFHGFYPGKFNNKTNGISHRRWLMQANPGLTALLDDVIGAAWKKDPLALQDLLAYGDDPGFLEQLRRVKWENKVRLSAYIQQVCGVMVLPDSIFDMQVKRLHMYKRQLLNIFHVMDLYNRICDDPTLDLVPRTYLFSAKAFPSYLLAKNVIKLIHTVADVINRDKRVGERLKVVFLPNYSVSLAERMIPAGDVSEQISTASKEASGTGNMKFMMNGAITCATLDGANVEICQAVGDENIILFGMTAEEVMTAYKNGEYDAAKYLWQDPRLQRIFDQMASGYFGVCDKDEFLPIIKHLTEENDPYFILQDFASYAEAQRKIDTLYRDPLRWGKMSATNIGYAGMFSSDYTIQKYAEDIWSVGPVTIE